MFSCFNISAQDLTDSLEYIAIENPPNLLSTKFDKQLSTYFLNSSFLYNKRFDKINLNLSENYSSTFIKSAQKSTRDEQFLTISSAYDLNDNFNIGLRAENKILSDNRSIEINQASNSDVILFTMLKPEQEIFITPYLGYLSNRQIGQLDNGFTYGAEALINNLLISDFNINSQIKFKNEDIDPRKNTNRFINLFVTNNFDQNISNSITTRFVQSRRDFYYKADDFISNFFNVKNNIQSRTETGYLFEDKLAYKDFIKNFDLNLLGSAATRSIDRNTRYRSAEIVTLPGYDAKSIFDTRIDELNLDFESRISFHNEFFNGEFRFLYGERDEKHITKSFPDIDNRFFIERSELENQKNNNSTRASLSISGNINFSKSDILTFSLYQNKLRYNTPSELNFDDRDELLTIARFRYNKLLSPYFISYLSLEGTLNQTVYIFSEKSSNNNLNRILKLTAGGYYFGKNFSSNNNFEVSANYTVYDFEDINPNYKSFSFRQFTATDSSALKLSKNFDVKFYGYVKLSEQGDLKWGDFLTTPNRFLAEIYSEPRITYNYNDLKLSAGIRYFSIKTYNYEVRKRIKASDYLSVGPLTEVILFLRESLYLRIYGWYEFITTEQENNREQANLTMEMNWNF